MEDEDDHELMTPKQLQIIINEASPDHHRSHKSTPRRRRRRVMQKVPSLLRCDHHQKLNYDPAVVAFGPYHFGKPELNLSESFKPKALQLFAAGSGKDTTFYYEKVAEVIGDVRRHYSAECYNDDDDAVFTRMMLHDACFLINYIHISIEFDRDLFDAMEDHLGDLVLQQILRDIFVLENQIPFWFLKLLMHLRFGKDRGEEILGSYSNITIFREDKPPPRPGGRGTDEEAEEEPLHLLKAFRRLLASTNYNNNNNNNNNNHNHNQDETKKYYSWSIFPWFETQKGRVTGCLKKRGEDKNKPRHNLKKCVQTFRSATDLKSKGFHFKPSPSHSLKAIKFTSFNLYGELHLPTWFVSIYTKVFFLNMLAFEMCPNTETDKTVST